MKKIPTVFERDWNGDRARVVIQVNPVCMWVMAGEGIATRKIDGTCCMVRGGVLFKRRELKQGDVVPVGFEGEGFDEETRKTVGWVPVGDGKEDQYHRKAFRTNNYADGTYELLGPKVQSNPENYVDHRLVSHSALVMPDQPPRDFAGLYVWLTDKNIEGIVWHHPDGRMAKIKLRDFGLKRAV